LGKLSAAQQEAVLLHGISSPVFAYAAAATPPNAAKPAEAEQQVTGATKVELSPAAQRLQQAREALELLTRISRMLRQGGEDRWALVEERLSKTFDQIIEASAGTVTLGTKGNDGISGWSDVSIDAGEGDDVISAWSGSRVEGGAGNDTIDVWSDSTASGGDGDDLIKSWSNSVVSGGAGDDVIDAWSETSVDGGEGNDIIKAWSDSRVSGGAGDDVINAWSETEVDGGEGDDVISAWTDSRVNGGDGNDVISAHTGSVVTGGRGDDAITLRNDAVAAYDAGDGHDKLATLGDSTIRFGAGITADSVSFSFEGNSVRIAFAGSETDSITLTKTFRGTTTLAFADGSTLEVPRPADEMISLPVTGGNLNKVA
jgi:RTX calcium-binding nonapeptide repeat (4 copies)